MSLYDRQQGIFDGVAIGTGATARRYGAAINEWEAHADALKGRLHKAEARADQANAGRAAMAYLIGQLSAELAKYAPNHPLVDMNRRIAIVEDTANKISSGTHTFEPKTGTLKPVIR